jgi:hypothetical protein
MSRCFNAQAFTNGQTLASAAVSCAGSDSVVILIDGDTNTWSLDIQIATDSAGPWFNILSGGSNLAGSGAPAGKLFATFTGDVGYTVNVSGVSYVRLNLQNGGPAAGVITAWIQPGRPG